MALQTGRCPFQLERDNYGHRDHGQIHGEPKPGEERAFICAVVSGIGGGVFKEKGAEQGEGEEDMGLVFYMPGNVSTVDLDGSGSGSGSGDSCVSLTYSSANTGWAWAMLIRGLYFGR